MRWFRMYSEVMNDPKVQRLPAELFRFWVNCMCLASENGGNLPPVEEVSWVLRKNQKLVSEQIESLRKADLLDLNGEVLSPHNWHARQYKSDTSTDRVRKFREKHETFQKRSGNGYETADETHQNTDTDTDTDTENTRAPKTGAAAPRSSSRKKSKRTTEEIRECLGPERMSWWDAFWKVYPCRDGMNPAMDAYDRKVLTRDVAVAVYNGAKRYAAYVAHRQQIEPNMPVKYAQGWINDERWHDEFTLPKPPATQPAGPKYKNVDYDSEGNLVELNG